MLCGKSEEAKKHKRHQVGMGAPRWMDSQNARQSTWAPPSFQERRQAERNENAILCFTIRKLRLRESTRVAGVGRGRAGPRLRSWDSES